MKIIYVHHADINYNDKEKVQLEENLLVEKLANIKASAIYTSTDPSCKHTAELLKKKLNVQLYEEERFIETEELEQVQEKTNDAIDEIVNKHNSKDDVVICIGSGNNVSAFIYYFTRTEPCSENPWIQALTFSTILFTTNN